ncbi:MAG TPA: 3'-5' exonuclease [Candidatus Paceibacterota bacterium]
MKKHKLAFIDIETTGLDTEKHEIIQIGCVLVNQIWPKDGKPTFEILDELELKIKPERISLADKVALKINGYNEAAWAEALNINDAMKIFSQKTADTIMVAHNVAFDFCFLAKAFSVTGVENKMHYHKLDTISIAFAKLHLKEGVDRFSLQFLCDYFKIENKNAHTALSDCRATLELYQKLMSL